MHIVEVVIYRKVKGKVKEVLRGIFNMKGTWQARSLSAGQ